MERMKTAEEIMIPMDEYPHVPYWFSLRQTMAVMEKSEFEINGKKSLPRFVLVFDEEYQLMGIARRRDILRGLEPEFLAEKPLQYRKKLFDIKVDPNLSELSFDKLLKGVRERAERPVSEVMRPIQATVNFDDHIIKVIYELVSTNISLVPVIKENKIIGVVRSVELFNEISKLIT
jgi:CBS-domain-containing membrane protein